MTHPPIHPAETALFDDPLKGWGNDDLMIADEGRERFKALYPDLFRVLDWPQLREAFKFHDALANAGKSRSRQVGVGAVLVAGAGVAILALIPAIKLVAPFAEDWQVPTLSIICLAMMLFGGFLGLWHWLGLRARDRWMSHRFWTERLRQLHFQLLARQFDLVEKAIGSDAHLAELNDLRARTLNDILTRIETQTAIRTMIQDITEREGWLVTRAPVDAKSLGSAMAGRLLGALRSLRINVQLDYIGRALSESIHGPAVRARALGVVGDVCTLAVLPVAALGGLAYTPIGAGRDVAEAWIGLANAIGAFGLMARTVHQGLRGDADLERGEWYFAALRALASRFDEGGAAAKLEALRDLEDLSYQELRRFLITHRRARFLI
jgi:hypothetical protein